ncbi:Uncharacterized protein Rs2_10738 [Raphanus sativus]|nr:Uncharacterized protein Rs2_10738 [Raphanus sativus]
MRRTSQAKIHLTTSLAARCRLRSGRCCFVSGVSKTDRHFHRFHFFVCFFLKAAIEKAISGERLISSLTFLLSTDLLRRHLLSTMDLLVVLSTVLSTDLSMVLSTVTRRLNRRFTRRFSSLFSAIRRLKGKVRRGLSRTRFQSW